MMLAKIPNFFDLAPLYDIRFQIVLSSFFCVTEAKMNLLNSFDQI
jgi:hypothetical protein